MHIKRVYLDITTFDRVFVRISAAEVASGNGGIEMLTSRTISSAAAGDVILLLSRRVELSL